VPDTTIATSPPAAVLVDQPTVGAVVVAPRDLHRSPPVTLRRIRHQWSWLVPTALALFVALGVAAAIDRGAALVWDSPITDAFVALRSPAVDQAARWASRLGSTPVVLAAGAAGVALAARRCRSVALVMLVTVAARPLVEWLLKELVERPRPSGARLVAGTGFSYPSGHVLAAAATWGFVPLIAGLYVRRRWIWWTLTTLALATIAVVAWSRVWLGVHWTSDVVGSLALAFVALSIAEVAIDRIDRCRDSSPTGDSGSSAGGLEEPETRPGAPQIETLGRQVTRGDPQGEGEHDGLSVVDLSRAHVYERRPEPRQRH
jgi:membrane-associated phospholipid phosphatase